MRNNYSHPVNVFTEASFSVSGSISANRTGMGFNGKKNALVLCGGSVKGCFQAGALMAVLESGFIPDIIYGISVGSLNGAFIANAAGKKYLAKGQALSLGDWKQIGGELMNFWLNNIRHPEDVATQRGVIGSVLHILMHRFNGLADISPIKAKIEDLLDSEAMEASPVKLKVGSMDFISGRLSYKSVGDKEFVDYLNGSFAVPVAMPPEVTNSGKVLFDGGVGEIAPLGAAINGGAENIVAILCQSEKLNGYKNSFSEKDLMKLIERMSDIIVNQNVKNDSEWITYINKIKKECGNQDIPSLKDYKSIQHIIIEPTEQLDIDITNFTVIDIVENMMMGYETARRIFTSKPVPWLV